MILISQTQDCDRKEKKRKEKKFTLCSEFAFVVIVPCISIFTAIFRNMSFPWATVVGPVVSASVKILFEKMISPQFLDFIKGQKFSPTDLLNLKTKFIDVEIYLNEAAKRQIADRSEKKRVNQVTAIYYDAEDVLNEVAFELSRSENESSAVRTRMRDMIPNPFKEGIREKITKILDRLNQIQQPYDFIGQQRSDEWSSSTGSRVNESEVIGRTDDKEEVIQFLLSNDAGVGGKIGVIPIVGTAGIGKTTLVQLVYKDSELGDSFDPKAWVCISGVNDVYSTTAKILEAVTLSPAPDRMSLDLLQRKLEESLNGKKFLLILDNVLEVNSDEWLKVQLILESGAEGSKIIVTTRNQKVAETMAQGPIHHLKCLSYEHCCLLFERHAFELRNPNEVQELREIGREIVAKFKGSPLAAKALGGHLRSKADATYWNEMLRSELWDLPIPTQQTIISALRVSYEHLPSQLKRCFDYCSIFPKGYAFDKQHLVLLWMAEDLLLQGSSDSKTMEEVGHEYIDNLIAMSIFQPSSSDESRFVMHDLFNDLAKSQSLDICFWLEGDQGFEYDIPVSTRRFSYIRKRYDAYKKFEALEKAESLRTFLPISSSLLPDTCYLTHKVPNLLLDLKKLRVLSVSGYHNIRQLPESIGKLKLLRYMDVSGTAIKELPDSTCKLLNLQTLILSDCYCLTKLPTNMRKLINLRHLDVGGTILKEMPKHMSKLKNLHTLTNFTVSEHDESKISELGKLNHLQGALNILNLQNVVNDEEADEAKLKDKTKLDELLLEWSFNHNDASAKAISVLEKLEPHKELKRLTIKHYVGEIFPDWLVSFSNIVFLSLSNCRKCTFLPSLGKLCRLRELSIVGFEKVKDVGSEFYGNDTSTTQTFGSLEILRFEDMLAWENWSCSRDKCEFTRLRKLYIVNCPKLNRSLLDNLPPLEKLELADSNKLVLLSGKDEFTSLSVRKVRISDMLKLRELPPGLMQKLAIKELVIYKCPSLNSFPVSGLLSTLKMLHIGACGELDLVSDDENQIISYASLKSLSIGSSCDSLMSFQLGSFPELNYLCLSACSNLNILSIRNGVQGDNLKSLSTLYIWGCPELESFPQGLSTPNLSSFWVWNCKTLKTLPEGMCNLSSLRKLYIGNCPELEGFPQGGLPSNLESLCISCCDELTSRRKEWNLQELKGLQCLEIGGECKVEKSFPEESLLPLSLTSLKISLFPKVEYLEKRGLQKLYSLQELKVSECVKLECLPKDCQLKSLSLLEIQGCPKLNKWCNGKGWPKISHIPNILIDEKLIS